jgi:hypothetical protein
MKPKSTFRLLPLAAKLAIVMFGAAGFAAAAGSLLYQPDLAAGRIVILLVLAGAMARTKVNLYRETSLSFLTCVVLLAVITQGPAAAVLVSAFGVTVQSFLPKKRIVLHQVVFNVGMISVTVVATWWIHQTLIQVLPPATLLTQTAATVLASFTYFLGNSISVSLIVALSKGLSAFQIWSKHFMYSAPSFLIAGILSLSVLVLSGNAVLIAAVISVIVLSYYCSVRLTREMA